MATFSPAAIEIFKPSRASAGDPVTSSGLQPLSFAVAGLLVSLSFRTQYEEKPVSSERYLIKSGGGGCCHRNVKSGIIASF